MIEFKDNQPVIDLVSKKPRGLLMQLEEQGLLGRRANNKALLQVSLGLFGFPSPVPTLPLSPRIALFATFFSFLC